jgi:putative phosphoribosyl transferase
MTPIMTFSHDRELFADRIEAGDLLAAVLGAWRGALTVVLGIPRGGLIVAERVAGALGASLDVVLARKIGAPGNPEYALGAVSENGQLVLSGDAPLLGADPLSLERERVRQWVEVTRRAKAYRAIRSPVPLAGRTVIVVDDGLATGVTMQAALRTVRRENPSRLVAAVPVAPQDTLDRLEPDADSVISLWTPEPFAAVGQFYRNFDQVDEERVLELLRRAQTT